MRSIASAAYAALMVSFLACAGSPAGEYALVTINGEGLPYTIDEGFITLTVVSGSLSLTSGGAFTFAPTMRIPPDTAMTGEVAGSYKVESSDQIRLTMGVGNENVRISDVVAWEADQLTLILDGGSASAVFRRVR